MKIRKDKTAFFTEANFKKVIIAGKKDPVLDFERLKKLSVKMKSEFIGLEGGHMSQIEDLADLKSALLQFINS